MKKIVVFGYSVMSLEAMKHLNPNLYEIVFVGKDEAEANLMRAEGFKSFTIDFRNDDDLRSMGIGTDVDVLFCFYPKDSDNVFLTISARAMAMNLTIIAIVDEPESAEKLLAAGADKIIDPYEICGRKTYDMLIKPDITNIMDNTVFGRHDLNMAQIEVFSGSSIENILLTDIKAKLKHNVIIVGVVDKEFVDDLHIAIGEQLYRLKAGDVLVVLGSTRAIGAFKYEVERVAVVH